MSALGDTLDALTATIAVRRDAGDESYTHRLLAGAPDALLKKVMEEAGEVALAAKDAEIGGPREVDHLRYEAADVVYHLLVVLERYGITSDDLAAELNARMTEGERPAGARVMSAERVNRG